MTTKSQTRITLTIDGTERNIFSIHERASGDLLLTFKNSTPLLHNDGSQRHIQEQHWSVHQSTATDGTTIKHTLLADSNYRADSATFIHNTTERLLWPIFFQRIPDLRQSQYQPYKREKDSIVNIGSYNPNLCNPVIAVIVSYPNNLSINYLNMLGSVTCICFHKFQIIIVRAVINAPSMTSTDFSHPATTSVRINNIHTFPDVKVWRESMTRLELLSMINQIFLNSARDYMHV